MKRFIGIGVLLLTIVLGGCVTQPGWLKHYSRSSEEGLVVLSMRDNSATTPQGGAVAITNAAGKVQWLPFVGEGDNLTTGPDGLGAGYYVIAMLAPGQYTVSGWLLVNGNRGMSTAPPPQPLTFELVKGRAIYLGDMYAVRSLNKAEFLDHFTPDMKRIRRFFPATRSMHIENQSLRSTWWALTDALVMASPSTDANSAADNEAPRVQETGAH